MPVASTSTLDLDGLLTASNHDNSHAVFTRASSQFNPIKEYNDEFFITYKNKTYNQQYANLYYIRLAMLKPRVSKIAAECWTGMKIAGQSVKPTGRVLDVRQGELCWTVGTIYMEMSAKPNILDDVTKDFWATAPIVAEKYRDFDNDEITLEDESGRLNLVGPVIKNTFLVTGCVVAVLGSETASGDFDVVDIKFPGLAPQKPLNIIAEGHQSKYIALLSGLNISGDQHEKYQTSLLFEYLAGELGSPADSQRASEIVHVIVAGNSLAGPKDAADETGTAGQKKKYGYGASSYNPNPTSALDSFLAELSISVNVDVMPGDHDPTNHAIPQQALHPALISRSRKYLGSSFKSVANPYWWDCDGLRIFGTSGQPINDIYKYVEGDDRIQMMEHTLQWQHAAPTAPDTLWCYPFVDRDPFILSETPHLYFAGNQPKFDTKLVKGDANEVVRVIAVPEFSKTSEIVLVDISTLECQVVKFEASR
ncbi:DNA polymerase alpha/epsilon subunit B-domain-containing protein [Lipomyces japonicus]|uniref:DNA polymerase alpha/epsilon subunit B-domain-containing protein n=1 Tax=Lipomyces japonicus TaxID=56871 RepID=UPI0034CDDEDE